MSTRVMGKGSDWYVSRSLSARQKACCHWFSGDVVLSGSNFQVKDKPYYVMKKTTRILAFACLPILGWLVADAQLSNPPAGGPPSSPPRLPTTIPPPPSFAMPKNNNGKFHIVSAEYYSQDAKPYLYKRLVKFDSTTGQAWVLHSSRGQGGEVRRWLPLTDQ